MRRTASRTATELARLDRMRGVRATIDPLKPDVFSLALDTREQIIGYVPLNIPIVVAKLPVGDISVPGFESRIAIDRKQLGDFIGCVTWERERFTRLLEKMAEYDFAAVVIEATMTDVRNRKYRAKVEPSVVFGAAASITTRYGVPVIFCGSTDATMDYSIRLLRCWWKRRGVSPELSECQ